MEVLFKLIIIIKFRLFLRALNVILTFLPFFINYNPILFTISDYNLDLMGCSSMFFFIVFVLQMIFLKRYKVIGKIIIDEKSIEIIRNEHDEILFIPSENLDIFVEYTGYAGEEKYFNPLSFQLWKNEGIGRLEIKRGIYNYKYKFLSEKNYFSRLREILDVYEKAGNKIDLRKD